MTTLFAQGWALPHQPVVTIRAGDAAAIIDAIIDYAPLSGLYICVCGYEVEDYDDALEHVVEAHGEHMHEDLEAYRANPDNMFRLTKAQMDEIENERVGAETIAPYIAF